MISSLDKLCSTCPLQKHFSCFLDSVILSVLQANIQSFSRYLTGKCVEKSPVLLFLDLLSLEIYNSLGSFVVFPKDCLSFTAYENFYKLSIMHYLSCFVFHFLSIRSIRKQKFHNQTYIHLYTVSSIHKYMCGISLSCHLLPIIIPFLSAKGLSKCESTHFPN